MSRPTTLYSWATNLNYAAGPDVGTPTRSAPTTDEQADGFHAGSEPAAQLVGALLGNVFDWLLWLSGGEWDTDFTVDGNLKVGGAALTFASFTWTLTDPNADGVLTMHAVAHGRSTGDGPVRVTTSGTLPLPLVVGTDYWIIRLGPDDFQLATSLSRALQGAGILFTTSGSGTQTLVATGSTKSVKDATITGHAAIPGLSPWQTTIIGAAGIEQVPDNTKVQRVGSQLRFSATRTGTNGVLYPISIPVGQVLSSAAFTYDRAGNALAFSIVAQDLDTGAVTSAAQILVNDSTSSGVQSVTASNFATDPSGHPIGTAGALTARADRAYWILVECTYTSGTPIVYGIALNPT